MVSEHRIRLRGAWEWSVVGEEPVRIILPTVWPAALTTPIRLRRRFNRPLVDPAQEMISLSLEDVPGLRRAWINDRLVSTPQPGIETFELDPEPLLLSGNLLALEVDPMGWKRARTPWGSIALVIRDRGGAGGDWPGEAVAL